MNTANQPETTKAVLKTITIIHFALCMSVFAFGAFMFLTTENATLNLADTADTFFFLVPVFAILAAFVSQFLFRKNLKRVQTKNTLKEKLVHYQSSKIIQFALIEGAAFFSIAIFMITTNLFYLIIAIVLLTYLIFLRPSTSTIKEDLDLNAEQEREFRNITR